MSIWDCPVFKAGDVIICHSPQWPYISKGHEYIVEDYQPRNPQPTFTWPAYVFIIIDGVRHSFHASRFTLKE